MIERQKSFLVQILGQDGASALFKSADHSELLAQALFPRAIFSWVKGVGEYEGFMPGGEELISFAKSETGFNGTIGEHELKDASLIHVAAVMAVTMGTEKDFSAKTKSVDLEKLGKSIDLLVRSKLAQESLSKAEYFNKKDLEKAEIEGGAISKPAVHATTQANSGKISHDQAAQAHMTAHKAHMKAGNVKIAQSHFEYAQKHNRKHLQSNPKLAGVSGAQNIHGQEHKGAWPSGTSKWAKSEEDLEKANPEAPVKNAAPVAPTAPVAAGQTPAVKPAAPKAVATAPKLPKIKPAGATVALTRSEMNHVCPMCAGKQFEGDEFVGCVCFSALNKSIEMLALDELGCAIHISEDMGTIMTLLEAMGRG